MRNELSVDDRQIARETVKERACEGRDHASGMYGHDGPARYLVHVSCPYCGHSYEKALCAGRVMSGMNGPGMVCDRCRHADSALAFWTLEDLPESELPAPEPNWATAALEEIKQLDETAAVATPAAEPVPAAPSLEDLLSGWRQHLEAAGRRTGTVRIRISCVRRFAGFRPDLLRLSTSELESGLADARATVGPAGLRSIRDSLRSFYQWAAREQFVTSDPSAPLAPVRVPAAKGRSATDDQVRAGLEGASPQDRAIILLARYAGLRRSEIASLHTRDRSGDRLRIDGKGGRVREVVITAELRTTLEALENAHADGWYFPGRFTGHVHPDFVHAVITRRVGINPHALRHAAATAAYRATKDLQAVQEFLGHASLATTQVYLHVSESQLRAVADAAGRLDDE